MSDDELEPGRSQGSVWIIGHSGHGKKTLAAAIARRPRTRRFIVIDDSPSRPEGTQTAILVVSAADGPMPQTRDHLKLAHQAGVPRVVIFLNKIDAADMDLVELVEMELRQLSTMCGFEGEKIAVIRGSAKLAMAGNSSPIGEPSIERLLNALDHDGPVTESASSAASGGGLSDFFRRLFE